MAWRPHPRRADVNPDKPDAWATCDFCGFICNHSQMRWQYQYAGHTLVNLRYLVCEDCWDRPQPQLQTLIVPADPPPLFNARPEPYTIDETDWRTTQDDEIRETQDGDLRVTQPSQTEATSEDPG